MRRLVLPLLLSVSALSLVACGDGGRAGASGEATPAEIQAAPNPLRDAIEAATAPVAVPETASAPSQPDPALVRIQILLDRSTFSPGLIDGLSGDNVRQAAAAFRKARGLQGGDALDAGLIQALTSGDGGPVTTTYRLTETDVAGPFSPPPGADLAAQARDACSIPPLLSGSPSVSTSPRPCCRP